MRRVLFCNIAYLPYYDTKLYNGRAYNLCAQKEDCVLLPEHKRTFKAPRARMDGFGFGQSNLWYASGEKCRDYVEKVFDYIDSYAP